MAKEVNGYKRKRGDRWDGRRIKVSGLQTLMASLWPDRTDREVYLHDTIDVTELMEFIEKKNADHPELKTTFFHCVIAAVAKMVYERPIMNRFIRGCRTYERYEISVAFVAKLAFDEHSEEALLFFVPDENSTVDDVSRLVVDKVKKVRASAAEGEKGGIDNTLDTLAKLPRPLLMLITKVVKWMDFWGINPKSLTEGDPHFATIFLSNLGSIKCPAVYHHLNN